MTSDDYSADALWTARVGYSRIDTHATFGQRVFDRLARIVPYWRVSDDAWALSDDSHLCGLGVLRNYGGALLVVPVDSGGDNAIAQLSALSQGNISFEYGRIGNVLVLINDGVYPLGMLQPSIRQFACLAWSAKDESLAQHIIKDKP